MLHEGYKPVILTGRELDAVQIGRELCLARELRVYPMRVAGHESVGTPVPLRQSQPDTRCTPRGSTAGHRTTRDWAPDKFQGTSFGGMLHESRHLAIA